VHVSVRARGIIEDTARAQEHSYVTGPIKVRGGAVSSMLETVIQKRLIGPSCYKVSDSGGWLK